MESKVNIIMLKFGIYPMLMALRSYQEVENYELCSIIKKVINRYDNSLLNEEVLSKRLTDIKETYPIVYSNMPLYTTLCRMELDKLNKS